MRFWTNKLIFLFLFFILNFCLTVNDLLFDENEYPMRKVMFEERVLMPMNLIFEIGLYQCSFSKNYIKHIKHASILRQDEFLKDYRRRLIKAFDACKLKESKQFFKQINENKKIILNNDLKEGIQVENIINYYYLIEPKSLLSEMKRMNYKSEDALLIMEKLEIDIAWEKRYDFKGQDEHFNRLLNKNIS